MSHSDIVSNYAQRKLNKRTNAVEWCGNNVFCRDRMLYSYGTHFPLARYMGEHNKEPLFLKNGDTYSNSTSNHQSITQRFCPGPTVSVSALYAAGVDFSSLEMDSIPFWRADFHKFVYRDNETGKFYDNCNYTGDARESTLDVTYTGEWQPPKQGMYVAYRDGEQRFSSGSWHILGTVVVENEGKYFLCSLDEGRYFVSQLSRKPKNINHAFELLKPLQVRRAEKQGISVQRQGEWFFVSTGFGDEAIAALLGRTRTSLRVSPSPLPKQEAQSNLHVCRHFDAEGNTYARGKVYHKSPINNRVTGEHKTLDLGEHWHLVFRNSELASWSQGGRFD
jgi:hypothetical protein